MPMPQLITMFVSNFKSASAVSTVMLIGETLTVARSGNTLPVNTKDFIVKLRQECRVIFA